MSTLSSQLFSLSDSAEEWMRLQAAALLVVFAMVALADLQKSSAYDFSATITSFEVAVPDPISGVQAWMPISYPLTQLSGRSVYRVRFQVKKEVLERHEPLGLRISGLFASQAMWNGKALGNNGFPSSIRENERPGLVDHVYLIDRNLLTPGINTVELEISSHNLILPVDNVFHRVALEPFSSDPRRSLREYTAPLIALGAIFFSCLVFFGIDQRTRQLENYSGILVGLFASVGVMAAIEISRAIVNYPYPFHSLRIGGLAGSAIFFGGLYLAYAIKTVNFQTWRRTISLYVLIVLTVLFVVPGWDIKTTAFTIAAAGMVVAISIPGAVRGNEKSRALIVSALPFFVAVFGGGDLYLDRYFYTAVIPFVINLYWIERLSVRSKVNTKSLAENEKIRFRDRSQILTFDPSQILAVTARGNYCEVLQSNGKTILLSKPLGTFASHLPAHFSRVHRSHIINVENVCALRRIAPGKYEACFEGDASIPVSRSRYHELLLRVEGNSE